MKKVLLVLLLMCTSLVGKASVIDGGYFSPVYDPGSITKSYTFHLSDQTEVKVYFCINSYGVYMEFESSMLENGETVMLSATGTIIVDGADYPLYLQSGGLETSSPNSGQYVDLCNGSFYTVEFVFEDVASSWANAAVYLKFYNVIETPVTPQDFYFTSYIIHDENSIEGNWDACTGTY
jgi:hypothetical protein